MEIESYILLKDEISRFCQLDNRDWEIFKDVFIPKTLVKNDFFAIEGKKAEKFGFVYSGCLRMFNIKETGKDLTKHFIRSGDFFVGAVNYYDKNSVSIQALNNCEILVTDYQKLEELSKTNKFISEFKNNLVSQYIQIKQNRENNYLCLESIERYKLFLINFPNLLNQIPHHFIASYLGVSATQLSRVRKKILNI
jgi:CRP-like cAMP-binding protein